MSVIRIEGFKDDKGELWVSNFLAIISGWPVMGATAAYNSKDT